MSDDQQIPVFVISMAADTKRRTYMQNMLGRLELAFSFCDAVNGRSMSQEEVDQVYSASLAKKWKGRELSRPEIGCALSHYSVWKRMVDENIPYAAIFEDDFLIGRMFCELIGDLTRLPPDWELFLLYSNTQIRSEGDPLFDIHSLGVFDIWPDSNAAYMLSLDGARKLVDAFMPLRVPSDHYTGREDLVSLKRYGICPFIAYPRNIPSSIGNREEGMAFSWQKRTKDLAVQLVRRGGKLLKNLSGDRSVD